MFEFQKEHLRIDPDMEIDCDIGRVVTAYVETWFDVDKKFGTQTRDDEDAWVNFYAKYNTESGDLITEYEISRAEGSEYHEYVPTENEKQLIINMMEECCRHHHDCSLKEYCEPFDLDMIQGGMT